MKKLWLFTILCILFNSMGASAQHIKLMPQVETKGDDIVIIGDAGVAHERISIIAKNSAGNTVQTEILTNDKGHFEAVLPVETNGTTQVYSVDAKRTGQNTENADTPIEMIAASVNLDGNYLTINGTISSGEDKYIGLLVENSNNEFVYMEQEKSGPGGKFRHTFHLTTNLRETDYTLTMGANGIGAPTVIHFQYEDRTNQVARRKIMDADIEVSLSAYTPHLTGVLSCSQGKTITMNIVNHTDNTIVLNETISYEDGTKNINCTLPSMFSNKNYSLSFTVKEGIRTLVDLSAQINSAIIVTSLEGSIGIDGNAILETAFSAENALVDDKFTIIKESKNFSGTVPNLMPNGKFTFNINGYEEYANAPVMDIKYSQNANLYNALKTARPDLDFDDDGVITALEMENIEGVLNLSNSGITNIYGIGQCTKVKYLDISRNYLTDIDALKPMLNLEYLVADHNQLTDLHGAPDNLKYIDVSHNSLAGLMGLKDAYNLEVVIASHNNIISTDGLQGKAGLKYLKVNNNKIESIDALADCRLLAHLEFDYNEVSDIKALAGKNKLKYLTFVSNPVESVAALPINDYIRLNYWPDWITDESHIK